MLSKEMQEKLIGEIKRSDKFIELIGIKIIEADEGYCKAELEVDDRHLNPLGTVHGGCLYTLVIVLFESRTYFTTIFLCISIYSRRLLEISCPLSP